MFPFNDERHPRRKSYIAKLTRSLKKNAIFCEGMTAAHGERWKINIFSLFPLHRISVPVSPRPMVQWLFNKITIFRAFRELRKARFWATHVNLSPRMRRHTSETFLFSPSDKRQHGRKSATRTYIRRVSDARQPSGTRCRAFSLCLNANKFVLLTVSNLMTICLRIWA